MEYSRAELILVVAEHSEPVIVGKRWERSELLTRPTMTGYATPNGVCREYTGPK
jgi:hypothetical protein